MVNATSLTIFQVLITIVSTTTMKAIKKKKERHGETQIIIKFSVI